ncbi:hypothetical protein L798_08792 [Zootermopsis nevadensis]|uniref:Uncharacterized protein n=1 Tax=Zootermopsis nevadensis TaxID=136037 RepID=A0A067R0Q1_ZOONE|nr:hypothetical protein L798_08792 [Zootermopsis nevadensis]
MAYIEKGQNFVEVTFTTNIKEENPIDITKDTSDAVCDSSLPVPWENFEFVSVKEEIIDEFLTDEHCLQQKRADKLDICIEECTISSENDIFCSQPFSQNEVQDTHRKFIISSEKVSVLITQKEVEQKSSDIHFMDHIFSTRLIFIFYFQCTCVFLILSAVT